MQIFCWRCVRFTLVTMDGGWYHGDRRYLHGIQRQLALSIKLTGDQCCNALGIVTFLFLLVIPSLATGGGQHVLSHGKCRTVVTSVILLY